MGEVESRPVVIHIVEDDIGVSDALAVVLGDLGHSVVCYPDGESFLEKEPPAANDLVLIDIGLPGIGGDEVIRRLNSMPQPPRVIAISGRPKNMLERNLAGLSSLVVLRKPLSFSALAEHLHDA